MRLKTSLLFLLLSGILIFPTHALYSGPTPVFSISLVLDHDPVVAGENLRMAIQTEIQDGWHINSNDPGDEYSVPTTLAWEYPEGWPEPEIQFAPAEEVSFASAENPLKVWAGKVVHIAEFQIPSDSPSEGVIALSMTAQACNDANCLPPLPVKAMLSITIAPPGTEAEIITTGVFGDSNSSGSMEGKSGNNPEDTTKTEAGSGESGAEKNLFLFLIGVFFAGLALNLTPCVFPLIPITMSFFSQAGKNRKGGTFRMASAYVIGIAVTYSALGVLAALTGQLFGSALQNPWIIGLIVAVLLALAASMFGLWEMRAPNWANQAAGAKSGLLGALLMGLVMGFVAAPCIGPFVLGLLTYVGQKGDPFFGFIAFFTLALGLGLPYLLLGTFTGAINKLPMSGAWMIGIRKVFGILLIAMAAYFAAPLLPGSLGAWILAGTLLSGGFYLLVIDRSATASAGVDRMMRALSLVIILAGLWLLPMNLHEGGKENTELQWRHMETPALEELIATGEPVIVDFYADWCLPCRELDEKTFSDPAVSRALEDYERIKMDQTRQDEKAKKAQDRFGIRGVPTVIVFDKGQEVFRITGFEEPERFIRRLEQ